MGGCATSFAGFLCCSVVCFKTSFECEQHAGTVSPLTLAQAQTSRACDNTVHSSHLHMLTISPAYVLQLGIESHLDNSSVHVRITTLGAHDMLLHQSASVPI